VQYFFSKEITEDFHKSIITILTPRRVLPGVYVTSSQVASDEPLREDAGNLPYLNELRKSSSTLLSVDDNLNQIM
jgi:hypothetical protein